MSKLTALQLIDRLGSLHPETEVRIGDVTERSDFHCSVGSVVVRNGCAILIPGEDPVWRDETVSSVPNMRTIWPASGEGGEDDKTE